MCLTDKNALGCLCLYVHMSTDNTVYKAVSCQYVESSTDNTIYKAVCVDMSKFTTDNTKSVIIKICLYLC